MEVCAQRQHAESRVAEIQSKVWELEQRVRQNRLELQRLSADFAVQVSSTTADRCLQQLFEVDRLHQVAGDLAAASRETEHRLSAEIRRDVLRQIVTLEQDLEKAKGQSGHYRGEMASVMRGALRELKQGI